MDINIKNPNNDVERQIMAFELRKEKVAYITELIVFGVGVLVILGFILFLVFMEV